MSIDPNATVADLVVERPARARVLERLGIDYCCGGRRSLAEACAAEGLDLAAVLASLEDEAGTAAGEPDWARASLADLCDHIVVEHHGYLRRELPRLAELLAKVEAAHGREQPETAALRQVFAGLQAELEEHMAKEEQVLFPACRALEARTAAPRFVPAAIAVMEDDHAQAAAALDRLRSLSKGYDLAQALCNAHRAALDGLRELELDLHRHIHEENNILFPRALALLDVGP